MSSDVNVHLPGMVNTSSYIHGGMDIGLDDIGITLQPTTSHITLESNSAVQLDLKPVSVDLCLTLKPRIPKAKFHSPYWTRLSFHVLGVELFGLSVKGEMNLHTSEVKQDRHVVFGQSLPGGKSNVKRP